MDFSSNVFSSKKQMKIPDACKIVWVADMFVEDYVGGAELTSEALIESSPFEVFKLHSKDVTMEILEEAHEKYWIFSNFSGVDKNLIPSIVANMKYSIVEYDYKYCRYRSPEKHKVAENTDCDCQNEIHGKMISTLFCQARSLWWMSEKQMDKYHTIFPFLSDKNNTVLSSVFSPKTLAEIKLLREGSKGKERKGWIVLGSTSWVKGSKVAQNYCDEHNLDYEVVWNLPYQDLLKKLSAAKGFVYLPQGGDTCPRMVIEAKLLGCELILNDDVQHKDEDWFNGVDLPSDDGEDEITKIEQYLYACREWFWNGIRTDMDWTPTLSGYTTTKNCISQEYPYERTIECMMKFCDEVVVVDGGSTDGTWERLVDLVMSEKGIKNDDLERRNLRKANIEMCKAGAISESGKLRIRQEKRNWDDKRFAVYDGAQKAVARSECKKDFCIQMDSDEYFTEEDGEKIKNIINQFPQNLDLIALPVIEYWGSKEKVRCDTMPWKWRLSRNKSHITHGIPKALRLTDKDGNLYAKQGTDGCDYIHKETGDIIPCGSFYTKEVEDVRQRAVLGITEGPNDFLKLYEEWFSSVVEQLPSTFHYSWLNIERKIKTYKNYWSKHWESLYDIPQQDTAENNKFFDKPWSEVSNEEISILANKLATEMGGWIFHNKIDWDKKTKWITCKKSDI